MGPKGKEKKANNGIHTIASNKTAESAKNEVATAVSNVADIKRLEQEVRRKPTK